MQEKGVQLLIDYGADIHAWDENYGTPLMLAVARGNKALVPLLQKNGARINAEDGSGHTVLDLAAALGSADMVRLLLGHGANFDLEAVMRMLENMEHLETEQPGPKGNANRHRPWLCPLSFWSSPEKEKQILELLHEHKAQQPSTINPEAFDLHDPTPRKKNLRTRRMLRFPTSLKHKEPTSPPDCEMTPPHDHETSISLQPL